MHSYAQGLHLIKILIKTLEVDIFSTAFISVNYFFIAPE